MPAAKSSAIYLAPIEEVLDLLQIAEGATYELVVW